ncbi:DDE superfamily endonuclease [Popillia japonica]
MVEHLFRLTTQDLRKLAYQWAEALGKAHCWSNTKLAGKDWLLGFLARHKHLSIRKLESTSAARGMGFNRVPVGQFFNLLVNVLNKYTFTANQIWNSDETGISVVPKTKSKTSRCRKLFTLNVCISTSQKNPELMNNCSSKASAEVYQSGWMQIDIFYPWFEKFVDLVEASKESPILLLSDGHHTYTRNIRLIDYARDYGVVLLSVPPHCTHRLQSLDVSFMKPLNTFYDAETGIWPCDPTVFTDVDFVAAETTDIPMPAERVKRTPSPATPGCSGWSSKRNIQASANDIVVSTLFCSLE